MGFRFKVGFLKNGTGVPFRLSEGVDNEACNFDPRPFSYQNVPFGREFLQEIAKGTKKAG